MVEKTYLCLLTVFGFLCQGIIVSLSTSDIRNSSDFLIRNKRVINHEPGGHASPSNGDSRYIVNIRLNNRSICAGAILSSLTVITAARCVEFHLHNYQVQAGSAYAHLSRNYSVISRAIHSGNDAYSYLNSIALIKVDPPFILGQKIGIIELHVEPVLTGTLATVGGWGCSHPTVPSMGAQHRLRSVSLPIISNRECKSDYEGHFNITNRHICTYHANKLCALYDIGTPLVINNFLVGIHIYKGSYSGTRNPDVFLNVQDPEFSAWIMNNTLYE